MSTLTTTPAALTRTIVQVAETPIGIRPIPDKIVVADGENVLDIAVEAVSGDDGVLSRIDYTINADKGWVFSVPRPTRLNSAHINAKAIDNSKAIKAKFFNIVS